MELSVRQSLRPSTGQHSLSSRLAEEPSVSFIQRIRFTAFETDVDLSDLLIEVGVSPAMRQSLLVRLRAAM